jgi:hypothetical protein
MMPFMPFTISVRDNQLVVSADKISVAIPPSQGLKEGLWMLINEEIKTINFKDGQGTTITLSNLSQNDINIIRNFVAEHIV